MLSLLTSWKRRMTDDVLLRTVLPNLCSANRGTLAVKDQSCYVSVSFHFLGKKKLIFLFSPFADLFILFSLPGALVSAIEVVPVFFRQHCVSRVGSYFFNFAVASHCDRYWNVQCDPSIEPMRPTSFGQAETACKSHHFAICPRLM